MYCADSRFKIAVYGAHSSIGDEVMALRVLFSIKFLYPNSHLTFLANSSMPFSLFKIYNLLIGFLMFKRIL